MNLLNPSALWIALVAAPVLLLFLLKIRRRDGSLHEETLTVRRSVHGPVVTERDGKALALRVVGLDQPHMAAQYWDMLRAQNLDEFEAALARLQNPFFTVMYADRDGRIMHLFGGRTGA